jgi:predicted metal-dependent HD superfamily phosphohydrolase
LAEAEETNQRIAEVRRLILVTKHNALPGSNDDKLIADIDLSILGQTPDVFDRYEEEIREEYAFVPDSAFREGRSRILKGFLGRPSLYLTESFRVRYEAAARANLARSLERLR